MKTTFLLITAAMVGGCASGGGSGSGSSGPQTDPALQPLRAGYEPSPCGTLYGYPVQCVPTQRALIDEAFQDDGGFDDAALDAKLKELGLKPTYTPPFTNWASLPPTESSYNTQTSYQFDTLTSTLGFTESSKRAAGYTYQACTQHVRWGPLCSEQTVAPVPGAIAGTSGGTVSATTTYGPHYDGAGNLHTISRFSRFGASFGTLAAIGEPAIDVSLRNIEAWETGYTASNVPRSLTHFNEAEVHEIALAANPYKLDWNYQSFGVWSEMNSMVASSFGAATPASAVPTSGQAQFNGKLAGLYVSPAGEGSSATANVTLSANFSSRSLTFASSGTTLTRDFKTATAAPNLDLSGTFTYTPASNTFTGNVSNAGATMAGSSTGRYYGPTAQELGGVFSLKASSSIETFTGAYGAKR
jgi:hypothetical protein